MQGLLDDGAGESFGWVDADEQGSRTAFGGPGVRLGGQRVVDPGSPGFGIIITMSSGTPSASTRGCGCCILGFGLSIPVFFITTGGWELWFAIPLLAGQLRR